MRLKNLVTLVTGGSQGLGKTIAKAFLEEGAHLAVCARDRALLDEVKAELKACTASDQGIIAASCDVSEDKSVSALFGEIEQHLGPVDVLVNNAGVYGPKGPSEEIPLESWTRAIEINLFGTFVPIRYAVRQMKAKGRGKIINLSGGGATNPLPKFSAYAASKAAVVRLTETLAEELRSYRIDINAIAPGPLNTRLLEEVLQAGPDVVGREFYEKALKQNDSGGAPLEKAADLCVYLASPLSDGITGKLISALWDPWQKLHEFRDQLNRTDIYALRRITPEDRGLSWR
jgi:NAD(P)-dependent dehydrogenase (short-subunit alcohol dehydrogenase family)